MRDHSNPTQQQINQLLVMIDERSLADYLWELVCIPSPTGREKTAALRFASLLTSAGAEVELDETIPNTPSVIGKLKGNRPGRTLQFAGHIDHIDIPHPEPRREDNIISGRGSADMKNGLAGILEIVRLLKQSDSNFPGEILITVYGLHEAPQGNSQALCNLIDTGQVGDAAIVFEGPDNAAVIMSNGMAIWDLILKYDGPACHELSVRPDRPDLLATVCRLIDRLRNESARLQSAPNNFPMLPQQSLFIGQVHYGDFYNRLPNTAFIQGTRRWQPDESFDNVRDNFNGLLKDVSLPPGIHIDCNWLCVGDSYQISPDELIVKSLIGAFQYVHNKPCPTTGHSSVTDVCRLVKLANIPAVLCGFGTETGHSDYEYVTIDRLKQSCAVALVTAMNYLNAAAPQQK